MLSNTYYYRYNRSQLNIHIKTTKLKIGQVRVITNIIAMIKFYS